MEKNKKRREIEDGNCYPPEKNLGVLGFFPPELSVDILSRLPVKILVGLRCISREWKHFVLNRHFVQFHLERNQQVSGFFYQGRYCWTADDVPFLRYRSLEDDDATVIQTVLDFIREDVVILGSSGGLLCCRSCISSTDPTIYVINPAYKGYVKVSWLKPSVHDCIALAFDPFMKSEGGSTKFKVVRVRQARSKTRVAKLCFSFEIYSSDTNLWKTLKEVCYCDHALMKDKKVFIAGILYWLTDGDKILTFDVKNEFAYLIGLPADAACFESLPDMCIGESARKLRIATICEHGYLAWSLENRIEETWASEFASSLEDMDAAYPRCLGYSRERLSRRKRWMKGDDPLIDPLAIKDDLFILRVVNTIVVFNIRLRCMKELCPVYDLGENFTIEPAVVPYTATLVPLN